MGLNEYLVCYFTVDIVRVYLYLFSFDVSIWLRRVSSDIQQYD